LVAPTLQGATLAPVHNMAPRCGTLCKIVRFYHTIGGS